VLVLNLRSAHTARRTGFKHIHKHGLTAIKHGIILNLKWGIVDKYGDNYTNLGIIQ
jgi:hypothetical protein